MDSTTQAVTEALEQWANPGAASLTLEAFCVELNVLRDEPWVMPRTIVQIVHKLNAVGITTVAGLAAALNEGGSTGAVVAAGDGSGSAVLNAKLVAAGMDPFSPSTLANVRQLLCTEHGGEGSTRSAAHSGESN